MVRRLRALWQDQRGAVLIEGLLVFPLVLLSLAALIEFGALMHRAGKWAKALEVGARLAAVSDPVVTDWSMLMADFPAVEGGALPSSPAMVHCGRDALPCDAVRFSRLITGSDGLCDGAAPDQAVRGICDLVPEFPADQLRISYTRTGQGVVRHDRIPMSLVTLDLPPVAVELPVLSQLISRDFLAIPVHPVMVMGEDLETCPDGCP